MLYRDILLIILSIFSYINQPVKWAVPSYFTARVLNYFLRSTYITYLLQLVIYPKVAFVLTPFNVAVRVRHTPVPSVSRPYPWEGAWAFHYFCKGDGNFEFRRIKFFINQYFRLQINFVIKLIKKFHFKIFANKKRLFTTAKQILYDSSSWMNQHTPDDSIFLFFFLFSTFCIWNFWS